MWIRFLCLLLPTVLASSAFALTQPTGHDASGTMTAQTQTISPGPSGGGEPAAAPAPKGSAPAAPPAAVPKVPPAPANPQPTAAAAAPPQDPSLPEILRGDAAMPDAVRATWSKLVEAAKSGDVERLRPIMDAQKSPPSVAFQEIQDPIEYLKSLSGDAESREILAILLEVLEAGFVHVDKGTPQDMYVWPYFAQYPLDKLTPPQVVELFRLLTSADYEEMRSYGAYIFFRVGITPDGTWSFFVAGD